jgi:hypothetical protein
MQFDRRFVVGYKGREDLPKISDDNPYNYFVPEHFNEGMKPVYDGCWGREP